VSKQAGKEREAAGWQLAIPAGKSRHPDIAMALKPARDEMVPAPNWNKCSAQGIAGDAEEA
jgi:hypothetical protein